MSKLLMILWVKRLRNLKVRFRCIVKRRHSIHVVWSFLIFNNVFSRIEGINVTRSKYILNLCVISWTILHCLVFSFLLVTCLVNRYLTANSLVFYLNHTLFISYNEIALNRSETALGYHWAHLRIICDLWAHLS